MSKNRKPQKQPFQWQVILPTGERFLFLKEKRFLLIKPLQRKAVSPIALKRVLENGNLMNTFQKSIILLLGGTKKTPTYYQIRFSQHQITSSLQPFLFNPLENESLFRKL